MSVLIKGMDIPKECVKAEIYKDKDDKWVLAVKDKEYYTDTGFAEESTLYEFVEVPTPHGRLVDVDASISKFNGVPIMDEHAKIIFNHCDTVIEAEVEE